MNSVELLHNKFVDCDDPLGAQVLYNALLHLCGFEADPSYRSPLEAFFA